MPPEGPHQARALVCSVLVLRISCFFAPRGKGSLAPGSESEPIVERQVGHAFCLVVVANKKTRGQFGAGENDMRPTERSHVAVMPPITMGGICYANTTRVSGHRDSSDTHGDRFGQYGC